MYKWKASAAAPGRKTRNFSVETTETRRKGKIKFLCIRVFIVFGILIYIRVTSIIKHCTRYVYVYKIIQGANCDLPNEYTHAEIAKQKEKKRKCKIIKSFEWAEKCVRERWEGTRENPVTIWQKHRECACVAILSLALACRRTISNWEQQ